MVQAQVILMGGAPTLGKVSNCENLISLPVSCDCGIPAGYQGQLDVTHCSAVRRLTQLRLQLSCLNTLSVIQLSLYILCGFSVWSCYVYSSDRVGSTCRSGSRVGPGNDYHEHGRIKIIIHHLKAA
jgi:hypothetical protein